MTRPAGWNARAALSGIPATRWTGRAWRFHRRGYEAADASGSLVTTGRYHRGSDQFQEAEVWLALYLALRPEVAVGEVLRHFGELMPQLNEYRLTELEVDLTRVLDCRDPSALGLAPEVLVDDYDVSTTQELGAAAIAHEAEGILVPSATGLGDNLVIFPDQLQTISGLTIVGSRDPKLYVPR